MRITAALVDLWNKIRSASNPDIERNGRSPSAVFFCRSDLPESQAARYPIKNILRSSDGCIVVGPTAIHLDAPPEIVPSGVNVNINAPIPRKKRIATTLFKFFLYDLKIH